MKKKLNLFANSIKLSVLIKPTALILFLIIIVLSTLIMSIPIRFYISWAEEDYFNGEYFRYNIGLSDEKFDFNNYIEIGNVMNELYCNGLTKENAKVHMSFRGMNQEVLINNKTQMFDYIDVYFVVNSYGFTREEINNGVHKIFANPQFMEENFLNEGDTIIFSGCELEIYTQETAFVERYFENERRQFFIPYKLMLNDFNYYKQSILFNNNEKYANDTYFTIGELQFGEKIRHLTHLEKNKLRKFGFSISIPALKAPLPLFLVIFIPAIILVVLNVLISTIYLQKVNGRKYSLYKLLGMPTHFQSGIMFSETSIIAVLGVGIGVLFEYLIQVIFNPAAVFKIEYLAWLYYLLLFIVTLITVLTVVGIKAIKHAKAKPADVKYLA